MGKGRLRRLEAQAAPVILCVCGLARPLVPAVPRQQSDGETSAEAFTRPRQSRQQSVAVLP